MIGRALLLLSFASGYATEVFLEAKPAYLYPIGRKFRHIYSGGGIYGVEFSVQMHKRLYLWSGAGCFHKTGRSIKMHTPTEIFFVPIPLGFKYVWRCKSGDFYIGLAAETAYVHTTDRSRYVHRSTKMWAYGGLARIGYMFNLNKGVFFSLFADGSALYAKHHQSNHPRVVSKRMDLSFASGGISLGIRFGGK